MAGSHSSKIWRKTVVITAVLLLFGFGVVIGNLVRWQIVRGEELRMDAVDQSLQTTALTPTRGTIYDASGTKILAQSASVWTVVLEPNYIDKEKGNDVKIAAVLSEVLDMDYDTVLEKTQQNSYFTYLKRKVETDVRDEILARLKEEGIGRGVSMIEDFKRYYPYGSTASTVLGFTGTDGQGLAGVENSYNDELSGTAGRLVSARNALGTNMPFDYDQYVEATNGYDLVLTIDETVQSIVEKHLEAGLVSCGALEGGTAILMDIKNGAIIALSTKGDYNPNDPFTISETAEARLPADAEEIVQEALNAEQQELNRLDMRVQNAKTDEEREEALEELLNYKRMDEADIAALREEALSTARVIAQNRQWRNKTISDTYYPGSVFKMFTAAAALESGSSELSTSYTCTGQWKFREKDVKPIKCWYHAGHGPGTLADGVLNSCNPFMIYLGQRMGSETFFNFFKAFGFTERTGIDLPGESSSLYYTAETLGPTELATESFGQGFTATPIQVITGICSIANGGYIVQPHVVARVLDSEGNIVRTMDTGYKRQAISTEVAETITKILAQNAISGGGKNGYVAGYRIAGKTGTSEKIATKNDEEAKGIFRGMQYVVSYGGFAPADDPQYALLVFYDEPQIGTPAGGTQAGPVFASIMEEVLPYLGVDPQYTEEEYKNLAAHTPNVLTMTIGEAKKLLSDQGFECRVIDYKGDNVNDQSIYMQVPSPGADIPKGGTVALYTAEPTDADYVEVPKFVGYSHSDCNYLANIADLQLVFTGNSSSGYAQSQDIPKGEKVKRGSVVRVAFTSSGGIETAG